MSTFTIVVICLFLGAIISTILFMNDVWYELTGFLSQFFMIASVVIFAIWLILLARKNTLKNYGSDYDYLDSSILEIKSITNYGDNGLITKDNNYYTDLINRIEKYNKYIDNETKDYEFYKLTPSDKFLSYQKMIYNYNDNTIYWENGISIIIETKEI